MNVASQAEVEDGHGTCTACNYGGESVVEFLVNCTLCLEGGGHGQLEGTVSVLSCKDLTKPRTSSTHKFDQDGNSVGLP